MALRPAPERVDIPHEPGEWMDLRKLSWKQMHQSRKKQEKEYAESARSFGGEIVAALQKDEKGDVEERANKVIEKRRYKLENYDMETLLVCGIDGWSYDRKVDRGSISDLDEATAVWACQTLIDMSRPPTEAEKKDSPESSSGT